MAVVGVGVKESWLFLSPFASKARHGVCFLYLDVVKLRETQKNLPGIC